MNTQNRFCSHKHLDSAQHRLRRFSSWAARCKFSGWEVGLGFHWIVSFRGKLPHGGPGHRPWKYCWGGSRPLLGQAWQGDLSDWAKQLGCASILYSFITLLTTKDTWYSSSTTVKRLFRLCMNAFGKWSCQVMESAGKSAADSLGIALHLVDMLPTIPLQLTFNTVTAGPLGHTPKALTYASQCGIDRGAITVIGEELIREPPSAKDEAMQAIWCVMATRHRFYKDHNCMEA